MAAGAGVLLVLVVLAGVFVTQQVLGARPLLAVLETEAGPQDEEPPRVGSGLPLRTMSLRHVADVDSASVWVGVTRPTTQDPEEMVCLVTQHLANPDVVISTCSPEEHIREQGFLWHRSQFSETAIVSLYLLPDDGSPADLPVDDLDRVSDRAQLYTGSPPPWVLPEELE